MIIGFEDFNGNPVVKTEEEKKEFLKNCGFKEDEVIFADNIPSTLFVAMGLLDKTKKDEKDRM